MNQKEKTPEGEVLKNKKPTDKPKQFHTPEGPAEEFINEYDSDKTSPPPSRQKPK